METSAALFCCCGIYFFPWMQALKFVAANRSFACLNRNLVYDQGVTGQGCLVRWVIQIEDEFYE